MLLGVGAVPWVGPEAPGDCPLLAWFPQWRGSPWIHPLPVNLVMAAPAGPPMPIRLDALSAGVKALLTQKGIPYWAQMAQAGYTNGGPGAGTACPGRPELCRQ